MPVGFLTADQEGRYARFAGEPNDEQLSKYFHLDAADRRLINRRHGDHNKLGFAVQLATVRFLGTFLSRADAVPAGVVTYLAQQLDVVASGLSRYGNEVRWDHAAEIRDRLGYREFTSRSQARYSDSRGGSMPAPGAAPSGPASCSTSRRRIWRNGGCCSRA